MIQNDLNSMIERLEAEQEIVNKLDDMARKFSKLEKGKSRAIKEREQADLISKELKQDTKYLYKQYSIPNRDNFNIGLISYVFHSCLSLLRLRPTLYVVRTCWTASKLI